MTVCPQGTFPRGALLNVENIKSILPTVVFEPSAAAPNEGGVWLRISVSVDFSSFIVGGDAMDELMELCAQTMRDGLKAQLEDALTLGSNVLGCKVVYKSLCFRDCGLFQYPMQRVVEGLLGVVPGVLFELLAPSLLTDPNRADEDSAVQQEESLSSLPTKTVLTVECRSLDFGVNLFHVEYLQAFAEELAWVVGSTSRLSFQGLNALSGAHERCTAELDLSACAIGLTHCTEINPSNICQILGTCMRAKSSVSSADVSPRRFAMDVSGCVVVPLVASADASQGQLALTAAGSPLAARGSSSLKLIASPLPHNESMGCTASMLHCWRLQLLEMLEFELAYLHKEGVIGGSSMDELPRIAIDGFLDLPEGYTIGETVTGDEDVSSKDDVRRGSSLVYSSRDGGKSAQAILARFAREFPMACQCVQVPITGRRQEGEGPRGTCVVATLLRHHGNDAIEDRLPVSSPLILTSSPSPKRVRCQKPLVEEEEGVICHDRAVNPVISSPDASVHMYSLDQLARITTTMDNSSFEMSVLSEITIADNDDDGSSTTEQEDVDVDADIEGGNLAQEAAPDSTYIDIQETTGRNNNYPEENSLGDSDGPSLSMGLCIAPDTTPIRKDAKAASSLEGSIAVINAGASPVHIGRALSAGDARIVPPSRRRLLHHAHSLQDAEAGRGACVDGGLHVMSISPSRSTVGPCRSKHTSPSRIGSEAQEYGPHSTSATPPKRASISPPRRLDLDPLAGDRHPSCITAASDAPHYTRESSTPGITPLMGVPLVEEDLNPVVVTLGLVTEDTSAEVSTYDAEAQVVDAVVLAKDSPCNIAAISPSPDRIEARAPSMAVQTPNNLNNTLPPGYHGGTPVVMGACEVARSISRLSSIAPSRTNSPTDGHSQQGGLNSRRPSLTRGGTTVIAGLGAAPSSRASYAPHGETVFMMADVDRFGPSSSRTTRTVISTVHLHNQHPHEAVRRSSTTAASTASSRVASVSPMPIQPSGHAHGGVGGGVTRTSSVAVHPDTIQPHGQLHSLRTTSLRALPPTLQPPPKPFVPHTSQPMNTPTAEKPKRKNKESKVAKRGAKSAASSPSGGANPSTQAPPSFFQGLLNRHELVKTSLSIANKGGMHLHAVRGSTTPRQQRCDATPGVVRPALGRSQQRTPSASPVPSPAATSPCRVGGDANLLPDSDIGDAVRKHLMYAPRPVPLPVTDQCREGIVRCISRRSASIAADIHGWRPSSAPNSRSPSASAMPQKKVHQPPLASTKTEEEGHIWHHQTESAQSCWSEDVGGGAVTVLSRSPSRTVAVAVETTAVPSAAIAVPRTSSVRVRVRRPSQDYR